MEPKITQRIIRQGKRVGMFMAFREENATDYEVGYALCSKEDRYSHELAKKICESRAFSDKGYNVPSSIQSDYDKFEERCKRYFKDLV